MMTACMSGRVRRSLYPLPGPESSEKRSTSDPVDRVLAELRDLEYTALSVKSLEACTAGCQI